MPDKAGSGDSWLQYDTEGNLIARLDRTPGGKWILVPEPGFPFVIEIKTGKVFLWDLKNSKKVKFAKEGGE